MGNGVFIKKGQLIDLLNVLREKYGDIKLSDIQEKMSKDDEFDSVVIYQAILGGKKIKIYSKSEGIFDRLKKKGKKLEDIRIEKR